MSDVPRVHQGLAPAARHALTGGGGQYRGAPAVSTAFRWAWAVCTAFEAGVRAGEVTGDVEGADAATGQQLPSGRGGALVAGLCLAGGLLIALLAVVVHMQRRKQTKRAPLRDGRGDPPPLREVGYGALGHQPAIVSGR